MRRLLAWMQSGKSGLGIALTVAVIGLGRIAPADAAVIGFTGDLALQIALLDPIAISGAGFATVQGRADDADHLASLQLEASPFGATGVLVPASPSIYPIQGVLATAHNGAGAFSTGNGALGGVMPILGVAKVCLFNPCTAAPLANLSVPISVVGAGGTAVASGSVGVTVVGAPWTTGTVAVGLSTAMGFAHGPASGTSSTLNPSGSIRLVTPIFVSTNIGGSEVVPAFAFLTLHFVPEPGTISLLGAGIGVLTALGRSRRH